MSASKWMDRSSMTSPSRALMHGRGHAEYKGFKGLDLQFGAGIVDALVWNADNLISAAKKKRPDNRGACTINYLKSAGQAARSKRSRFITLLQAATKSLTNLSCA